MIKNFFISLFILLGFNGVFAQNFTVKVVDSHSGPGLPYAGIQINGKENIITNSEGYFTIPENSNGDNVIITVSFLGYKTRNVTLNELKNNGFTIKLEPDVFELKTVHISNADTNADSIMAAVKRNLKDNYKWRWQSEKKTVFYREGVTFKPSRLDIEMKSSTGNGEKEIDEANKQLKLFTSNLIVNPPQQFTDMLCDYYTLFDTVNNKPTGHTKFDVKKAVRLKDSERSVSINELQETATGILYRHIDTTKYYRIKSGLFATRDTVLSPKDFNKANKIAKNKPASARSKVLGFTNGNNPLRSSKFDFISKQELYEYLYKGAIQIDDNDFVYIIKFRPKKRKARYTGTLYVSEKDYAVIRADYALAEGKKLGGVNLKFFLGVKHSENVSEGTVIFKKRTTGAGYFLQYASYETGSYIYINRPLKLVEITDNDKESVAFSLKVEASMINREEYFNMSQSVITEAEFNRAKEEEFRYIDLQSYNPDVWKEYGIIEPLEEMKQFRAVE